MLDGLELLQALSHGVDSYIARMEQKDTPLDKDRMEKLYANIASRYINGTVLKYFLVLLSCPFSVKLFSIYGLYTSTFTKLFSVTSNLMHVVQPSLKHVPSLLPQYYVFLFPLFKTPQL